MDTLTENDLRSGFFVRGQDTFRIDFDTVVTEEAKLFAENHHLTIERANSKEVMASTASKQSTPAQGSMHSYSPARSLVTVTASGCRPKLEHMTNLNATELVPKNDPRIAFRGMLDTFQAQLLMAVARCHKYAFPQLADYLMEAVELLRQVMAADVKGQPLAVWTFLGLDADELRKRSHHPEKYYGVSHQPPKPEFGYAALELNLLRAQSRQLEIAFSQAFILGRNVRRSDIAQLLNRISSGLYILYCQALSGKVNSSADSAPQVASPANPNQMQVPIEISARHVHLSTAAVEKLFGHGYKLTRKRDLSQTGEFLCEERVTLRGSKGEMSNVAILGPERSAVQVELSFSDSRSLGLTPPVRLSGDLSGAADVLIIGPQAELNAVGSAIVARNHIHLAPTDAEVMGLRDKQLVNVSVDGDRPLEFRDVVVRVRPSYRKFMHIDFDEANAAHISSTGMGQIKISLTGVAGVSCGFFDS